jgi:hypothetical protein
MPGFSTTNGDSQFLVALQRARAGIAEKYNADVLLFNGPIRRPVDSEFILYVQWKGSSETSKVSLGASLKDF